MNHRTLVSGLDELEAPRWRDGKLYFSEMGPERAVMAVDRTGRLERVAQVPGTPVGLGFLPDGRMLVVSRDERRLYCLADGVLSVYADIGALTAYRSNDMVVSSSGNAYVSNWGFDCLSPDATPRPAEIVLVTPDRQARVAADWLGFPNGMVITPDGKTLVVAESVAARLTAFDIGADGELENRRVWAQFDDRGFGALDWARVVPDGICMDGAGAIWMASPTKNEVLRVLDGGEITHRVQTEKLPLACILGEGEFANELHVLCCTLGAHGDGRIDVFDLLG